jgi:serine/threonine protein kinase
MTGNLKTLQQFLNKYKVMRLLGEGGYGSVYLCVERSTKTLRAVKVLTGLKETSTSICPLRQRTVPNEVLLLETLSHPGIVMLLEVYLDANTGTWYLVQEFHPGFQDLFSYVNQHGALTTRDSAAIIRQLVLILQHLLEERGIDHRDVKDENILYNPTTKQIKLIDFGSAGRVSTTPYTSFRGTAVYIPPEYYHHRRYEARPATVWAVGCLSFILFSGDSPFNTKEAVKSYRSMVDFNDTKFLSKTKRVDFISECLTLNVEGRIDFSDLMSHPWLKI